jgi:hypothetical protein
MNEIKCGNCIYWYKVNDNSPAGQCRRYPPKLKKNGDLYPLTYDRLWCGEWFNKIGLKFLDNEIKKNIM